MRPCLRKGAKFGSAAKDSHLTDFWHNHQQTVNVQGSQFLNPQALRGTSIFGIMLEEQQIWLALPKNY